jgi:hypothetical protein
MEDQKRVITNEKATSSFITTMVVGQSSLGNSIVQSDLIPEIYTLQLGFIDIKPNAGGSLALPTAQAIVNWKIDGQQQRRVISIVSGATISGVCNGVDLKILDIPVGGDATKGMQYKVQATLSRGPRANIQQPPILYAGELTAIPGAPAVFAVPQDSGVISIFPQISIGSFAVTPGFFDTVISFSDASLPSPSLLGSYYPFVGPGWTALPPGTQRVTVTTNILAANPTFVGLLWGIEG